MNARQRSIVSDQSLPSLPLHIRLHHDQTRDRWILLAPERLVEPDESALSVLRLCDGKLTVAQISNQLAQSYDAPAEQICKDVIPLLQGLVDKDFVTV